MAAIPGIRFDITGASGSQGLLTPKSGWRCYVFPRGGFASQNSTGTLLTFDSAAIAGRFAALDWIQAGLSAANIRQVSAVAGNSLSVSGAALTISENDRIFIIGSTEPTISGGSVTYSTPSTTVRQRDDDGSDLYANSMITTNADGLVQFFSLPAVYDCVIQDGNRALQGSLIDVPVGVAEGVSTSQASVFGATVTINAAFGITGWATFGQTVTMNAALGVTGWATFGATVTMNAAVGVTGWATFGSTVTMNANAGVTGTFTGRTVTVNAALGVTGWATFGSTITIGGVLGITGVIAGQSDISARYFGISTTGLSTSNVSFPIGGWGSTATLSISENSKPQAGQLSVIVGGATYGQNPRMQFTYPDGTFFRRQHGVMTCVKVLTGNDYTNIPVAHSGNNATTKTWIFGTTPTHGEVYTMTWILFGTS